MKRVTVTLPDELADKVSNRAGAGKVSAYVVAALEEYTERESLSQILADWKSETAIPEEVRQHVGRELDRVGLGPSAEADRAASG